MIMITHQAVGVNTPVESPHDLLQYGKGKDAIIIK
jgi:hypothetical protein